MKELKLKKFLPSSKLGGDPGLKKLVGFGLVFLIVQVGMIVFSYSRLPPSVPLFYSRPWGMAQLAEKTTLWLFPFVTTLILLVNLVLAHFLFTAEKILATILIASGTTFAFLVLFTEIKIILLFY